MEQYLLLGILIFVFTILIVVITIELMNLKQERLKRFITNTSEIYAQINDNIDKKEYRKKLIDMVKKIGNIAKNIIPATAHEQIEESIIKAGLENQINAEDIYAIKIVLAFVMFGIATSLTFIGMGIKSIVFSITGFAAGYYLPDIIILQRIQQRRRVIEDEIMLFCDAITVACEAGLSLQESIKRISYIIQGITGEELLRTFWEIETGRNYEEALKELQKRSPSETLRNLADIILTTMKYGTQISTALKEYTNQIREKRKQKIQELS
ncbi:MAG: type II secretion system F family protein, partial [Caldanaerobacter sp.]